MRPPDRSTRLIKGVPSRILLSVDPFLPVPPRHYGGIERIVAMLAAALRERGCEVGLVAHPDSTLAVDYFMPWPQVAPASAAAHARNTRALLKAVAAFKPNLVAKPTHIAIGREPSGSGVNANPVSNYEYCTQAVKRACAKR